MAVRAGLRVVTETHDGVAKGMVGEIVSLHPTERQVRLRFTAGRAKPLEKWVSVFKSEAYLGATPMCGELLT